MFRLVLLAMLLGGVAWFVYRAVDSWLASQTGGGTASRDAGSAAGEPDAETDAAHERRRLLVGAIEGYVQQGFSLVSAEDSRAHLQRKDKLDARDEVVDIRLEVDEAGKLHRWIERRPG